MLRFPLTHPPLLAALAACGHGGKVLIANASYPHSTNAAPRAALIHLNLRPGFGFCATCREPGLAVCIATGDDRLNANLLLTAGVVAPTP